MFTNMEQSQNFLHISQYVIDLGLRGKDCKSQKTLDSMACITQGQAFREMCRFYASV